MICCQDISFKFSGSACYSLEKVNLNIAAGECLVITGKSGSGKTTLIRCINGLIPEFYQGEMTGTVTVNGQLVQGEALWTTEPLCGSVFQDPRSQFFTTNTTSEVAFGMENYGVPAEEINQRIEAVFTQLKINGLKNKSVSTLSSGEKQKIAAASAFALQPKVLVLDEPSANLDIDSTLELGAMIRKLKALGYTIVISEHRLYYLNTVADRIVHLENGRIAWDVATTAAAALSSENLARKGLRTFSLERLDTVMRSKPVIAEQDKNRLEVTGISFNYKNSLPVIQDISFAAESGEIIGIIGGNGEGKTTLVKILSGLLEPRKGKIILNGQSLNARQRLKATYFVMQDADYQLYAETVSEEVVLGCARQELVIKRAGQVLEQLGLTAFSDRHPGSLSGGQKQRVVIAAALVKDMKVLLMDEPTSGLDYENMIRVGEIVRHQAAQGKIICIISHDYEFLKYCCNRIVKIQEGVVARDFAPQTDGGFLAAMHKEVGHEWAPSS